MKEVVAPGLSLSAFSYSVHYQRIHPEYWKDRLLRVKSLGINTIQVGHLCAMLPEGPAIHSKSFHLCSL